MKGFGYSTVNGLNTGYSSVWMQDHNHPQISDILLGARDGPSNPQATGFSVLRGGR